jgi:hypothetical protein
MSVRRGKKLAFAFAALAIAAAVAAAGCGGGKGGPSGSLKRSGGGTSGGSSGGTAGGTSGGSAGPVNGRPANPVVYALVTTDNSTRTALPESISGAIYDAAANLVQLPVNFSTGGTGHRIFTDSGFAASGDKRFLFAGHNASGTVESFVLRTDGSLAPAARGTLSINAAPQCIVSHPTLPRIYVSQYERGSGTADKVRVIDYDPATGALSLAATVSVAPSVRGIAVDPLGRFFVTTHMTSSATGVALYFLDTAGNVVLPAAAEVRLAGASRPDGAVFDRTGQYLYVRDLDMGIYGFSVSLSGLFALNGGAPWSQGGFMIGHLASPTDDHLYVLTAFASEIHVWTIQSGGTLAQAPKIALNDNCQHMEIAPSGRFLFVSSRSAPRIHSFTFDAQAQSFLKNPASPFGIVNPAGVTGPLVAVE